MKMRSIMGIALIAAAAAAFLLMRGKPPPAPAVNPSAGTAQGTADADVPGPPATPAAPVPQSTQDVTEFSSVLTSVLKEAIAKGYVLTAEDKKKLERRKLAKVIMDLWPTVEELKIMQDTPVEFYGQVLDQFDQPVSGAKISCSWSFMGPQYSARELQSSPDGRFEILGLKALSIRIFVYPPPGYDEQVRESKKIQIAKAPDRVLQNEDYKKVIQKEEMTRVYGTEAASAYKGDKTKPVIFRLKKL